MAVHLCTVFPPPLYVSYLVTVKQMAVHIWTTFHPPLYVSYLVTVK